MLQQTNIKTLVLKETMITCLTAELELGRQLTEKEVGNIYTEQMNKLKKMGKPLKTVPNFIICFLLCWVVVFLVAWLAGVCK